MVSVPALRAADRLADSVVGIVGAAARSVILHGSLTSTAFRPGRSDIDVLAVVDGFLSDHQALDLAGLVRAADVGNAAGIDLHVVTAEAAAAPTPGPPLELHVGRYSAASIGFEVSRRVAAAPDLLAELSIARADGRALRGARPQEVIGLVPVEWIVDRGRYWLTTWQSLTDDAENAAFMVLTACRIWHFAVRSVHCSKAQAALWALGRDPSLTVVGQAVTQYEHDPSAIVDERGIAELLELVLRETARP